MSTAKKSKKTISKASSPSDEKAEWITRALALMVDTFAMFFLAIGLTLLLGVLFGITIELKQSGSIFGALTGALALIVLFSFYFIHFLYFGHLWSKFGQTYGMKALKIRVVRRNSKEPLSFWRAGFRGTIGYYISAMFFSLGFVWAAFDDNSETWHDKLFDTWVVKS